MTRVWPLPALAAWVLGWALFALLRALGAPLVSAVMAATAGGVALGGLAATPWRRVFVALGFPVSFALTFAFSGAAAGLGAALPAWAWLLPLALLALLYPVRAWRDAPLFPTPAGALDGLAVLAPLAAGARVLDGGCGLGDGLAALRRAYPGAALVGIEWSGLLRLACAWRCRRAGLDARLRRADLWAADWSGFDLVYLFQRPESMARAAAKARRELRPGAWLISLEFDAPAFAPTRVLECADGRRVWLYQAPLRERAARG